MTDPRHDTAAWRRRKFHMTLAEYVERAGDAVGSNDVALSSQLWAAAAALREYYERRYQEEIND